MRKEIEQLLLEAYSTPQPDLTQVKVTLDERYKQLYKEGEITNEEILSEEI